MRFFDGLRQEIVAWGKTEGMGWIFVMKTTVAALLAMGISMRLELGQPVTAMVTVFILMHPQTGMVLTKSLYRIFATLAGALASLVLLGLFAQERVLFLMGLALWVGLCAAGAAFFRNFKSYAFTLAGYTAAMISLPLVMQPTGFFDYAVNRVTEVMVGIICAGVVSEVVFSRSLGDSIVKTLEGRYVQFLESARRILQAGTTPGEIDRMHLEEAGSVATFESLRSSVFMEASEMRKRDRTLRRLNIDFLAMSTTLHSLCRLLSRLREKNAHAAGALTGLSKSLAEALTAEDEALGGAESACRTARHLAAFRMTLPERENTIRCRYRDQTGSEPGVEMETGFELLRRFVREMHDCTRNFSLMEKTEPEPSDDVRFASRTDSAVALVTGARAMAAIVLVAAFWIASAWPYGASAVMMAAICTALFAPTPDPALALKMAVVGNLIGFVAAFACKFFVLTSLNGLGLLVAGITPFLLVGSYLNLNPKLAMIGLGYSTMFCFTVSPNNRMAYDPVITVNFGSALILGVAAAALTFAAIVPVTGGWVKRRTARMLRREVEVACSCRLSQASSRFESGTRDLLQRIAARPNLQDVHTREILDWLFVVLEVGRAVIQLRKDAEFIPLPLQVSSCVGNILVRIERLFGRPNARNHSVALQSVEETIEIIMTESVRKGVAKETVEALRRILTSLHLIRSSLLDEEPILAAKTRQQPNFAGETSYAT